MKWFIEKCLELKFLVALFALILCGVGVMKGNDYPVDILPEFSPIEITVQTEALGLSAEEVENLVTVNLEEMLTGTPWVEKMESSSALGISSIKLTFYPGTDLFEARRMVQENLALASLIPNVSSPPVILQPTSSTNRVMLVGLTSDQMSEIDLSLLARWNIGPVLLGVPDVANISIWGEKNRQLQVLADPETLANQNVSLDQVIETAGDALWVSPLSFLKSSTAGTGGWIDGPNQRLAVRHELPISEADELAKVNVVDNTGSLTLEDVSLVEEGHQPLIGNASINTKSGIVLMIEKFPHGDVSKITNGLEEKLKELEVGLTGIEIDTHIFRPATFVQNILSSLSYTLLVGIICLSFLFVVFYPWRIALVSIISLFLTSFASVAVLTFSGVSLNILVLSGILVSLGLIIDMLVGRAESVSSFVAQKAEPEKIAPVTLKALDSTKGTSFLLFVSAVVLLLPILFVDGPLGQFYTSFVFGYMVSLVVALIVTTSVTAAFLGIFPPKNNFPNEAGFILRKIQTVYKKMLNAFEIKGALWVGGIMTIILLAGWSFVFSSISFFPEIQDRNIVVSWESQPGTSYGQTEKVVTEVESTLISFEGVQSVVAHMGRAIRSDEIGNINAAKIWVVLDKKAEYKKVKEDIQALVREYPGVKTTVSSYTNSVFDSVIGADKKDARIRVYGPEFGEVDAQAERIFEGISQIDGIVELEKQQKIMKPVIDIIVDLERAQRFGIKPGDVRRATGTLVNGLIVGYFFEDQKVYEVVVQGQEDVRNSLSSLKEMQIETPTGAIVRLEDIAEVKVNESFDVIKREAFSRYTDIYFDIENKKAARGVKDFLAELSFPIEYRAEFTGEYFEERGSQVLIVFIVCLVAFVLVLQSLLESWKLTLGVFITILFSLLGSLIVAMVVGKGVLSLGAIMGMVLILGLAVANGVRVCKEFREKNMLPQNISKDNIYATLQKQFVSIVFTALCIAVVFIPFAIVGHIPGHEIVFPLALSVLGGLVTLVLTSVLILPFLYFYFGTSNNEH